MGNETCGQFEFHEREVQIEVFELWKRTVEMSVNIAVVRRRPGWQ